MPGVRSPRSRNLLVGRNQDVEIGHFALVAGAGDQFERRDRREQAIVAEAIQVVGGLGVTRVKSTMTSESIRCAIGSCERSKPGSRRRFTYVTPSGMSSRRPTFQKRRTHARILPAARLLGDVHLDPGTLGEFHVFQRLEDAILVLGGNRHRVRPRNSRIPGMANRELGDRLPNPPRGRAQSSLGRSRRREGYGRFPPR